MRDGLSRLCRRDFHSNVPGLVWNLGRVGRQVPIQAKFGKFPADFPQIPKVHGVVAGPDGELFPVRAELAHYIANIARWLQRS